MTQKELLYYEDAIGHLKNIDKILNDFMGKVENQNIKNFFANEKEKLNSLKNNLTNVLGGNANG